MSVFSNSFSLADGICPLCAMDHLTVEVEIAPASSAAYPMVAQAVKHHIKSMIGVTAEVIVKQPGEIPRSQGKAVRVRDLRPKQL